MGGGGRECTGHVDLITHELKTTTLRQSTQNLSQCGGNRIRRHFLGRKLNFTSLLCVLRSAHGHKCLVVSGQLDILNFIVEKNG